MRRRGERLTALSVAGDSRGRAFVGALVLLCLLGPVGCIGSGDEEPPDPHRELRERLGLEPDREIHRVTLGGRGADEHVSPTRLRVGTRAVVEFLTVDGRVHTVTFPEDSLSLDAALFLRRTSQLSSPPLVDRGSRFVLSFEGAPTGRYRFRSEGPGGEAWGTILVGEEDRGTRRPERSSVAPRLSGITLGTE